MASALALLLRSSRKRVAPCTPEILHKGTAPFLVFNSPVFVAAAQQATASSAQSLQADQRPDQRAQSRFNRIDVEDSIEAGLVEQQLKLKRCWSGLVRLLLR